MHCTVYWWLTGEIELVLLLLVVVEPAHSRWLTIESTMYCIAHSRWLKCTIHVDGWQERLNPAIGSPKLPSPCYQASGISLMMMMMIIKYNKSAKKIGIGNSHPTSLPLPFQSFFLIRKLILAKPNVPYGWVPRWFVALPRLCLWGGQHWQCCEIQYIATYREVRYSIHGNVYTM